MPPEAMATSTPGVVASKSRSKQADNNCGQHAAEQVGGVGLHRIVGTAGK